MSDRFQCALVKPTDLFSTETKQTYNNSATIPLFTNINHQMTQVERKPLKHLYYLKLETNRSNKNAISKSKNVIPKNIECMQQIP